MAGRENAHHTAHHGSADHQARATGPRAPGKAPRTQRIASPGGRRSVQRSAAAPASGSSSSADMAAWTDVAMRPDLHGAPVQRQADPAGAPATDDAPAAAPATDDAPAGHGDAAPEPSASSSKPTLRKGAFGEHVRLMQRQLKAAGARLLPDSSFGNGTERALIKFQQEQGLEPTGVCDGDTWSALDRVAPIIMGPAETTPRDPAVQDLIDGKFADSGAYKPTGDGFVDATLDRLLHEYGKFWLSDTRAPANAEQESKDDESTSGAGGKDASGTAIQVHPPWVADVQSKLIAEPKWTDDCEATQKLLQAFLSAWGRSLTGGSHSSVDEFYHHVGKSEGNNKAKILGGFKGGSNWCAHASTLAAIMGLLRKGVRFARGRQPKQFGVELTKQTVAFTEWQKHGDGRQFNGNAAHTAQLEPGDIISLVGHGPLSGHVATVIEHVGDTIRYVSGNAGGGVGDGAIKAEQVKREIPPPEYNYDKIAAVANADAKVRQQERAMAKADENEDVGGYFEASKKRHKAQSTLDKNPDIPVKRHGDPRFKPGVHAPAEKGTIWVVVVTRTSRLNGNVLTQLGDEAMAAEGLERCEPLETAYPDYHLWL